MDFEARYNERLAEYHKVFDLEDINDANDRTLLRIMIRTELMIDDLQSQIEQLFKTDLIENASDIKKIADLLKDATNNISGLQKTLGIDRKTRRGEESSSVAEYIRSLKSAAGEFYEGRITRVYCPSCKVAVGRFAPVHDHTAYVVSFQCSQCGKMVHRKREEKDYMFDIKDKDWRKYRASVEQPSVLSPSDKPDIYQVGSSLDNVVIEADTLGADDSILPDKEV